MLLLIIVFTLVTSCPTLASTGLPASSYLKRMLSSVGWPWQRTENALEDCLASRYTGYSCGFRARAAATSGAPAWRVPSITYYYYYYRVSHNTVSTLFFVIFSGSGARTEERLTFIQQPWKFATL